MLQGGADNDQLTGGSGDDQLLGGDGNDILKGDAGIDKLWGDAGDDELWGGGGADELRGGVGTDVLHADKYDTVVEQDPPPGSSPAPEGEAVGSFTDRPNGRRMVSAWGLRAIARTKAQAAADFRQAADDIFGDFDIWDAPEFDGLLPA
jgi:hypothetical protein